MNSAQICFRHEDAHQVAELVVQLLKKYDAVISYGISVEHGKTIRYDHKPTIAELVGGVPVETTTDVRLKKLEDFCQRNLQS